MERAHGYKRLALFGLSNATRAASHSSRRDRAIVQVGRTLEEQQPRDRHGLSAKETRAHRETKRQIVHATRGSRW